MSSLDEWLADPAGAAAFTARADTPFGALGSLLLRYRYEAGVAGGAVVALFGVLILVGIGRIPFLRRDLHFHVHAATGRPISALVLGLAFGFGWTPCIGTTLGAILTLRFSQGTSGQAMLLSSGYALGLGLPFLAIGLSMERASHFVRRFQRHLRKMQIASGVFLILIGLMMLTNQITLIAIWAQRNGLFLDLPLGSAWAPPYFIALLAGLISFLSPCVLPLVPAYVGYLSGHAFGGVQEIPNPSV